MKPIERLVLYFKENRIRFSEVERETGLANGYLGKQWKNRASIGSDILEKICAAYPELDAAWVLTGKKTGATETIEMTPVTKHTEELHEPGMKEGKLLELYRLQVENLDLQVKILKEELKLQTAMVEFLKNSGKADH